MSIATLSLTDEQILETMPRNPVTGNTPAHDAGAKAFWTGGNIGDNPYVSSDPRYHEWADGYECVRSIVETDG